MYKGSIPPSRVGAIYNALSYATKIDAEAVALYMATHTEPGETVLDPFGGSGTTGITARLRDPPTPRMLQLAEQLELDLHCGPRRAAVHEVSTIGVLLSSVMTSLPDVFQFRQVALSVLRAAKTELSWLYQAKDNQGDFGEFRYVIWSEVLRTPCCSLEISTSNATVTKNPASFYANFKCPKYHKSVEVKSCACGSLHLCRSAQLTYVSGEWGASYPGAGRGEER